MNYNRQEIGLGSGRRVLIVDGLNTFIRNFCANPALDSNGDHVGGTVGFIKSIGAAIRKLDIDKCVVVFDGRGGSQSRRKIYSGYKDNRKHKLDVNRMYESDEVDEKENMKRQLVMAAALMDYLPISIIMYDGVEADDVIAYITDYLRDDVCIVMSTDKDFFQLISDHVFVYYPTKDVVYDADLLYSEYGIYPNNFIVYKTMIGDKSDNIPGIKGVGLKTVKKRFPMITEKDDITIYDILEFASEYKGKIQLYENVVKSSDLLERNYKLMQLADAEVTGALRSEIREILDDEPRLKKMQFISAVVRNGLEDAFRYMEDWISSTFVNWN